MPKIKTTIDSHAGYMVTFCTSERKPLLSDPNIASVVEVAILFGKNSGWYRLFSYIVMPDHVHILLVPRGKNISQILHSIKSYTAHKAIIDGDSLWQGANYTLVITEEHDLLSRMEYVELNPVRKGLGERPEDYPYSSAGKRDLMDSI